MRTGVCLPLCLVLIGGPSLAVTPLHAQQSTDPAAPQTTWQLLSTPTSLGAPKRRQSDTTQSIPKQAPVVKAALLPAGQSATPLTLGWTVESDDTSASLTYVVSGRSAPFGFACKRGDGFVTFRTAPGSYAAGKKAHVQVHSRNGTIKLDARSGADRTLESEVPIRTSSLVFVLTPKIDATRSRKAKKPQTGLPKLTVGGWSTEVPQGLSDVALLRFQSLCDQPVASAE